MLFFDTLVGKLLCKLCCKKRWRSEAGWWVLVCTLLQLWLVLLLSSDWIHSQQAIESTDELFWLDCIFSVFLLGLFNKYFINVIKSFIHEFININRSICWRRSCDEMCYWKSREQSFGEMSFCSVSRFKTNCGDPRQEMWESQHLN